MASSPPTGHPVPHPRSARDQRGVAFPSPLVMLSIVAIAMAGIAFVATQDQPALERRIETSSSTSTPSPTTEPKPARSRETKEPKKPRKPQKPAFERSETYVEVYNNSGITGLAASYAGKATGVGWQVVGQDNWYGAITASTVYHPERLEAAAEQLALDLGIGRTAPAVAPMRMDRLTVVLTADAG